LLSLQEFPRKHHQDGEFLPWSSHAHVMEGNFALSFSLLFLNICVHISGSIDPITSIWVSLERYFLLEKKSIILVRGDDVRSGTRKPLKPLPYTEVLKESTFQFYKLRQ